MQIIKELRNKSKWKDWADGLQWLLWHLICSLLPIWVTLFGLRLFKQDMDIMVFTNNGEFALYSASFLGTCLYTVGRDFRKTNFPSRSILIIIFIILLLLCAIMYSAVAIVGFFHDPNVIGILERCFDRDLVRFISWILLPTVIFLTFLIIVTENIRAVLDISEISKLKNLEQEFDQIQGRDING